MKLPHPILDLLDEYLSELTKEASTIEQYRKINLLFIQWMTMSKDHNAAEPTRRAFATYWHDCRTRNLSVRTLDNYTAAIRMFFKWLVDCEYFNQDITAGTKSLRKSSDFIKAPLPEEKAIELLNNFEKDSVVELRDFAIVNLMLRLALRRNEVSTLNQEDFKHEGSQWYVRIQGKGHNEKDAELPITTDILRPIRKYWSKRPGMSKGDPAFISHSNSASGRITPHFISVMVKARLRAIGLDDRLYSSHSLRHTAAYYAMKAGAKSIEVTVMLRQKDTRVAEQYLKAFKQGRRKDGTAIMKLGGYIRERVRKPLKKK